MYNQTHLGRDLDAIVALLRGSIDTEKGFIDIRKCAAIAVRLEQIACSINTGTAPATLTASVGPLQAQHARRVLGVDSRGPVLFLLFLAEHPEKIFSALEIANHIGSSEHSIRVYACIMRKRLKLMGVDASIKTVWGSGYFLPAEAAARVAALLVVDSTLN